MHTLVDNSANLESLPPLDGYICLFLGQNQSNMGENVSFRPRKYILPFNITRYYTKKVDLKEN